MHINSIELQLHSLDDNIKSMNNFFSDCIWFIVLFPRAKIYFYLDETNKNANCLCQCVCSVVKLNISDCALEITRSVFHESFGAYQRDFALSSNFTSTYCLKNYFQHREFLCVTKFARNNRFVVPLAIFTRKELKISGKCVGGNAIDLFPICFMTFCREIGTCRRRTSSQVNTKRWGYVQYVCERERSGTAPFNDVVTLDLNKIYCVTHERSWWLIWTTRFLCVYVRACTKHLLAPSVRLKRFGNRFAAGYLRRCNTIIWKIVTQFVMIGWHISLITDILWHRKFPWTELGEFHWQIMIAWNLKQTVSLFTFPTKIFSDSIEKLIIDDANLILKVEQNLHSRRMMRDFKFHSFGSFP